MPDLSERMREASRRRALRNRWIGLGVVVALGVAGLIYYQVSQRLLDAAGLRCGAGTELEANEQLEFSDIFQEWDQAETSGEHEFDDGSIYEWDFTEDVAAVQELAEIVSADPILLHLRPVHEDPFLVAADADTFVINNPGGYFDDNDQTVRVHLAERQIQWAYAADMPRVASPGPRALTDSHFVALRQRSVPGDQARLELVSYDVNTGAVESCDELLGPVDDGDLSGRHPTVMGRVMALDSDQFVVQLVNRGGDDEVMDTHRWTGLYTAADGELQWESAGDAPLPSAAEVPAFAFTGSDAVVLSGLPAPRYMSSPSGRLDDTYEFRDLAINSRLYANQEGEQVGYAMPGTVNESMAHDSSDGSLLWEYPGPGEDAFTLPAVQELGDDPPGAALMLRAESLDDGEHHDPRCAEGGNGCPVAWTLELLDDHGSALWSTPLAVGETPGAFARWGDIVVRQEDEDWSDEHGGNGAYNELTAYDLATGEELWTLESAGPAHIDQAVEAEDGWILFDHTSGDPPGNVRIIDAGTGEVSTSGGGVSITRGLQADGEYIVLQFGDGHTAVLERR